MEESRVAFVIGAPRSGSTLLARILGGHSLIMGRPEPHLLTPLAHLGVFAKVDKAPYDAVLAAEAQRQFVAALPGGERDYLAACRAYCDSLYGRMLATDPRKRLFLDKTPAYALVLSFIARLYPTARYVVLTRHPLAVFSSYAETFFNGDYAAAHAYNPILERYVPAVARFLRDRPVPIYHAAYERLVAAPEEMLSEIFAFLGVPDEPQAVEYGLRDAPPDGLGDPIGISRHTRPAQGSIDKWAAAVASCPDRLHLCRQLVAQLDPDDLSVWGYPLDELWKPLARAGSQIAPPPALTRYRLQRWLIVTSRATVRRHPWLRRRLSTLRLGLDVLLRE